jgi:hypothetical protein
MAFYLTGSERTVSLTITIDADLRSSSAGFSPGLTGTFTGYVGNRMVSGVPAPLFSATITGGTCSVSTPVGAGGASLASILPAPPYDVSVTANITATLTLVLQQIQDGPIMLERVKPGSHHNITYDFTTLGNTDSGVVILNESSTTRHLAFLDYAGYADILHTCRETNGNASVNVDLSDFACDYSAISNTRSTTDASGGTATHTCTVTATDITSSTAGTCGVGQSVTGRVIGLCTPKVPFYADIEPSFFDVTYGGTYKVLLSYTNVSGIAISGGGPARSAELFGPLSGVTGISASPGGLSRMALGPGAATIYSTGDRASGPASWAIVSASTTSTASPIAHPDHPDGDVLGVRYDQSDGLLITHDGARNIEDGSTITPSGGEWVSVSGGGAVTLSSGIRLAAGGSTSVFRRGWAVWSFGSIVSGAILDTRVHRFVTLRMTATSAFTVWVHLPGATTAIYGQGEGDDPGSSQGPLGGKRWRVDVTSGTNDYQIDLCNPDYWPLGAPEEHIDPPYEAATGTNGAGPPEGLGFADYPSYRGSPTWQSDRGNFSGVAAWSRMVFIVPASKVVTVNLISLDAPGEICVDAGYGSIALFVDGMHAIDFSSASGVPVSTVRANIDAVPGLTCTTSLTNGAGSAPAAYSLRSDWEQWRGQSSDWFYYGRVVTNLNRRHASSVGLEWPRIDAYLSWHPGGNCVDTGSAYGPTIYLTIRARFGGSFGGLVFREPHAMGDGSVSVAGDGSYAVDGLGRWGYGSTLPRLEVNGTHVISWDGWNQQAIKAGAGGRGIRRWTSFKGVALYVPYGALSADTNAHGKTAYAAVRGGEIVTGWSVDWQTMTWEDKPTGITGTRPCLRFDTRHEKQRCYLLYEAGGAILLRYSDDEGGTWSVSTTVWASGQTRPAGDVGDTSWLLAVSRTSGGAIEVKGVDRGGNVLFTATAVASGVADDSTPLTWDASAQRWYLLYLTAGGAVQRVESADQGKTWT